MGRPPRIDLGNIIYHVINRANNRSQIFKSEDDYQLFESILAEARIMYDMRILAYVVMPNHWHLVLYPKNDGDVSRFMQWVTLTHTQQHHARHRQIGHGHLYQGRYKSFPVERSEYLLQLLRYVERNPLRAKLVIQAEEWRWGSLCRRLCTNSKSKNLLSPWPIETPSDYIDWVNAREGDEENDILEIVRHSINRGKPLGSKVWTEDIIEKFNLQTTIRPRGRPKKGT